MRNLKSLGLLLTLLLLASACGKFRKIEKNPDWRIKYEAALMYFEKKDYYKASVLYEQIMPIIRGLPEAEKAQFNLAYCQYHDRLYLLAAEQFRTFYETFGRSSLAEEARYMYAYSLFKSSPGSNLDQTDGIKAMASMQEFLNRYPNSRFRDQAIEVIFTTQDRLDEKGFENAKQYYRMRQYKAALVALKNFKDNFPDSKYLEQAHYLIIDSNFQLAEMSIYTKQRERYEAVLNEYKDFVDRYPKSTYLRDAEKLYLESQVKLSKMKNLTI
ncbi:MAG: outer membrane protein assembly factor BamD [Cyclobacteriaceae bacterium]|jgi:outer membrane protein assembly factor BamD|nr:outer membrane protein assembly factor BamD [Cyclobacteriaceae bacterium]